MKSFDTVSRIAVISLESINVTQKYYQNVQLEYLWHHIKFHPDELNSEQENEANRLCFVLTLWNPAKVEDAESGTNW